MQTVAIPSLTAHKDSILCMPQL